MTDLIIPNVNFDQLEEQRRTLRCVISRLKKNGGISNERLEELKNLRDMLDRWWENQRRSASSEVTGIAKYGRNLEILGKKFQDPATTLDDLVKSSYELGLALQFRVEPNFEDSVEEENDNC